MRHATHTEHVRSSCSDDTADEHPCLPGPLCPGTIIGSGGPAPGSKPGRPEEGSKVEPLSTLLSHT